MTAAPSQPIVHRDADVLHAGPNQIRILAGVDTGEPVGAVEYTIAPGFAPPPVLHRHTREDAGWFVVDGAVEFSFEDGSTVELGPGQSVTHPKGCWFRWGNARTDQPARAICWFAPAGFERFFADAAAALDAHVADGGTMDDFVPTLLELRAKYGDEAHPGAAS